MTAPDKIWAWEKHSRVRDGNSVTAGVDRLWSRGILPNVASTLGASEYIRFAMHQSALADRDCEIERLRKERDDARNEAFIRGQERNELMSKIARLQARLKACPTVEQLRVWALSLPKCGYRRSAEQMTETANRMEALNDH